MAGQAKVSDLYSHNCDVCGGIIKLSDEDSGPQIMQAINAMLSDLHNGNIQPGEIHAEYYTAVANYLASALSEAFNGGTFGAGDFKNTLKAFLDHNIYAFSGARSLYMLQLYNSFLTNPDGSIVSEAQFINKVSGITEIDNMAYLKTERNSAITCAQAAEKWENMQAFGTLEYRTVGDDKVRPEHRVLDKLTRPTDDPIWSTIYPPNGWNCRCTVVPGIDADQTPKADALDKMRAANIPPYFRRNVGKERIIFSEDHPFIVKAGGMDKLQQLDAVKVYGLKTPEAIYKTADLPERTDTTKAEALKWWTDRAGDKKSPVILQAVNGLQITFDKDFQNHVLESNKDDRFKYLTELPGILKNPDEVWSHRFKDTVSYSYLKYYADAPIIVQVTADSSRIYGNTMFLLSKGGKINFESLKKFRKGVLIHRK